MLLAAAPALAAEAEKTGPSEVVFLGQIILLLSVGRLMGEVMQRMGQPAVMGQLLAGLLLGPSVLGALWPEAQHAIFPANGEQRSMIGAVSQLGILMLLLLTGMETDLSLVRKAGRAAFSVSVTGIAVPFACGFALGEFLPEAMLPRPDLRLITSLFLGTALSISSVKIVAMVVREMRFMRRNLGQVIVASAIIDDTIGWTIIAIIFGLALHGGVDLATLAQSVLGTALFLVVSFTLGRRLVFTLIRWTNDTFVSDMPVITTILVVMGLMALVTHLIGVHTVLGAFVAGILTGQSPILTRHIDEQLRGLITALFMPVFFGLAGLGADLTILKDPNLLLADPGPRPDRQPGQVRGRVPGRVAWRADAAGGAGAGLRDERARLDRGDRGHDRPVDGSLEPEPLHDDRRHGGRDHDGDAADPALGARALADARGRAGAARAGGVRGGGLRPQPRAPTCRRGREPQEPVRRAPGRAARRIARHAGHRPRPRPARAEPNSIRRRGRMAASLRELARAFEADTRKTVPAEVKVLTRVPEAPPEEAVASEARKGYGLLVVGVERAVGPEGGFHEDVARMASGFQGPLAVAVARGLHADGALDADLRILIPITGTEVSRRGAEVGLALARAANAPAMALHVAGAAAKKARRRFRETRRGEGGDPEAHRRPCRLVRRAAPDRDARRYRGRGRHPAAGAARRLQPDRHGGHPSTG